MGSLNALLWFENVLKWAKCVKNPLPSYFDAQYFTLTAMDNFDNASKNSLSRMKHAHDSWYCSDSFSSKAENLET